MAFSKNTYCTFVYLTIVSTGFSQNQSNLVMQYVKTYQQELSIQQIDSLLQYNDALNYNLPLVKNIELRLGTAGSIFRDPIYGNFRNEDQYGLMLVPNNLADHKKQAIQKNENNESLLLEKNKLINKTIHQRYVDLVNLFDYTKLYDKQLQLEKLYDQKQLLLTNQLENQTKLNLKELLQVAENKHNTTEKSIEIQQKLAVLTNLIDQNTKQQFPTNKLTFESFIKVFEIEKEVINMQFNEIYYNELNYLQKSISYREELATLDQTKNLLSGILFRYDQPVLHLPIPDNQKARNNFSIRADINIAFYKNRNSNYLDKKLKIEALKNTLVAQKNMELTNFNNFKNELLQKINLHKQNDTFFKVGMVQKLLNTTNIQQKITPIEWVDLQILNAEAEISLHKQYVTILHLYVDFLKNQNVFSSKPFYNFLSSSQN